ncbi:hypothetical protein LMG27174_07169 [Paraburkholderia rhynchosiae]|uniref:Uncharacterized protein n=1 Tax=Paraburkholderia rhynchosiae TaxID=487049 RepID=A0A6J5CUD1_9BURK|nr:hypothetical protein LMG27174_07169 [Paraburkholderia rhynchosiae]
MSENINGKVVVIIGASSGLGAETARHLAKEGAKVVHARGALIDSRQWRANWDSMEKPSCKPT